MLKRDLTLVSRDVVIRGYSCKIYSTPGDGNCMLHSLAAITYEPYHTLMYNGKRITRERIAEIFRGELLENLDENYHQILGGRYAETGKFVRDTNKDYLKELFSSKNMLGEETIVYLE